MSWPSICTEPSTRVPGIMSFMRLSDRRNVDLPQPEGPMNAVTSFGRTSSLMFSSTRRGP